MHSIGEPHTEVLSETTIVNEFTGVKVRKLLTRNGERLEVESLRLGHRIQLDALGLEALSWQQPETISAWLATPFGPEAHNGRPVNDNGGMTNHG